MLEELKEKILEAKANSEYYPIEIEIEADNYCLFSDPSTSPNFASFPIPPYSQSLGIIKSIISFPRTTEIIPYKVAVCSDIKYANYAYNYNGPLSKGENVIVHSTPLFKPKFIIYAAPVLKKNVDKRYRHLNNVHAAQAQFIRKLRKEVYGRTPYLGQSNLTVSYCGLPREETKINESYSCVIGAMPYLFYTDDGERHIKFEKDMKVEKGIFEYVK